MGENIIDENMEKGSVKISNDVVAIIAGVAATEVKGVVGMSGGITGGITELLGKKNLFKGVKVDVGEKEASIDVFIVVEYGSNISQVSKAVQENVKSSIENMTGLNVIAVNVSVQGVSMPKETKTEVDKK